MKRMKNSCSSSFTDSENENWKEKRNDIVQQQKQKQNKTENKKEQKMLSVVESASSNVEG